MVGKILELRDYFGGLVAEKVEITLRKMIDGGINEPTFRNDIGI